MPSLAALCVNLQLCKRWDDNIKMYLYLDWHSVDRIYVGKNTNKGWVLVSTVMNLQVHTTPGISWLAEELFNFFKDSALSHSRQSSHHMNAPNVLTTADLGHGTSKMLRTEISRSCLPGYLVLLLYQLKGCYVIQLINCVIAHSDRWEEQQWIQTTVQKCSNRNADHYGLFRLKRRKTPEERCE